MVEFPENNFTRMIEEVSRRNQETGGGRGLPMSADPRPSVVSASLGREVPAAPAPLPLSAAEKAELDRLAIEAGMIDERLDTTNAAPQYATLEDAIAASLDGTPAAIDPAREITREVWSSAGRPLNAPSPRARPVVTVSRLPNFKNVQGIDLILGVVYVDDLSFELPAVNLLEFRKFAATVARRQIMQSLDAAMASFEETTPVIPVAEEKLNEDIPF
jgi:hypothetical protein